MLVLIACFLSVSVIVAQGPRVTNITVVQQQPGSCATFAYFDLAGFTPNSEIFVESLSYREISCQNGAINDASWPRMSAGSSNGSGSLPYVTPIGGVSGTYTFAFSDSVSQITVTIQTNAQGQLIGQSGGSSNQVPAQTQPTPVPNVPQQGDQGKYPQGHEGVVWGGIHFGKYCGAQGFAEYNDGVNGSSWGCNGQSWNLDQVCRDIYGDALPYVSYKGTGLGDVFCSATSSNGGQPPVQQPDQMPSVSDKWCAVQRFDTDPATDRFLKGTEVHLFGRGGDCHPGNNGLPRATRFSIDGVLFGEKQMSENSDVFKTSGYSIGKHIVCFMVAADSDTTWEHRDEQCRTYTIYGQGDQPPADGNNNPVPTSKDCPGVLPSLVAHGTIAIVNTASNSNINVRSNAHISRDNILYKLAPLSLFSIVSGPICADGYRWWEIGYNGRGGYAAEADGVGYMYVPNGTALPYDPYGSVPIQPQVIIVPTAVPEVIHVTPVPSTQQQFEYENLMGDPRSLPLPGATYYAPGTYKYAQQFGQAIGSGSATKFLGDLTSHALTVWKFELPGTSVFEIACAASDLNGLFNNPTEDPRVVQVGCVLIDTLEATAVGGPIVGSLYFLIQALSNPDVFIDSWLDGVNQYASSCPLSSFVARKMGLPPPPGCGL
jgi:hypothetical protein